MGREGEEGTSLGRTGDKFSFDTDRKRRMDMYVYYHCHCYLVFVCLLSSGQTGSWPQSIPGEHLPEEKEEGTGSAHVLDTLLHCRARRRHPSCSISPSPSPPGHAFGVFFPSPENFAASSPSTQHCLCLLTCMPCSMYVCPCNSSW